MVGLAKNAIVDFIGVQDCGSALVCLFNFEIYSIALECSTTIKNCKTCSNEPKCIDCETGFAWDGTQCAKDCGRGFYWDGNDCASKSIS